MRNETDIYHRIGGECRPRHVDLLLADLALRQHGVVARWQLLERGVSARAIERRLDSGHLHRVHQGVYAVGHRMLTQRSRWMAAVLAGGRGAVLSHRSAAALWGILADGRRTIEVTVSRDRRPRARIQVHVSVVPPDERTVVDGIPVTTVPRTLFDLAAVVTRRQVERAWHEADVARLWDALSLPDLLARYPRRRGSATVRAVLDTRLADVPVTRNEFEERFVLFVAETALTQPEMNAIITVAGRTFEIDALWRAERLAVELDSYGVHGTRGKFESDRERDRILQVAGLRTARVTWRQLTGAPAALERDLRALLALGG
ncbi:MAG: type IV toxin-antitoxin system AbiEi family antitoxin domain-containing protein [Thermoleophilaceae bacterium]